MNDTTDRYAKGGKLPKSAQFFPQWWIDMKKFWQDQRGVSVVIGAVLMTAMGMTFLASVQVGLVPLWNAQVEREHYAVVYDDIIAVKSSISDVAIWRQPKSATVHMGRLYPNRMIFINPGVGITSSLRAENLTITVVYTLNITGTPSFTQNFTSSRLVYEAQGSTSNVLVYEHGSVIRDTVNANLSTDIQTMIRTDEIYIPLLDGTNLQLPSSLGAASLTIKPFLATSTISKISSVSVTLPTDYPEVWQQLFEDVTMSGITVAVDTVAKTVTINSTGTKQIEYSTGGVTENAVYSGILALTKRDPPVLPPTFNNIDPNTDYPRIVSITLTPSGSGNYAKTHSTLTATVMNTTGPSDIHTNLTDLTENTLDYDVAPDSSSPNSISSGSWSVPNSNTVSWTNITHPDFDNGSTIALNFWIYNSVLNQQYWTTAVFVRENQGSTRAWQD